MELKDLYKMPVISEEKNTLEFQNKNNNSNFGGYGKSEIDGRKDCLPRERIVFTGKAYYSLIITNLEYRAKIRFNDH